jgi:hypothetical protein
MIDTDKYEGHAEGEWTIEQNDTGDECAIDAQDYGTIAQTFYRDSDKLFYATSRLIADAPLLLEAYKELRERLSIIEDFLDGLRLYVGGNAFDHIMFDMRKALGDEEE